MSHVNAGLAAERVDAFYRDLYTARPEPNPDVRDYYRRCEAAGNVEVRPGQIRREFVAELIAEEMGRTDR